MFQHLTLIATNIGGIRPFNRLILSGLITVCIPTVNAADLMDLWKVAEAKDAKYLSAQHKYLSDKEVVVQSRADLLPNLSFQYEHKETDQTVNDSDNAVFSSGSDKYPTLTYGVSVSQSVFDYSRWQRYSQSKVSSNKAFIEYSLAKQQLLLRLAENYFLVLEREDQLQTLQAEKAAMQKHLDSGEKKYKSGMGSRVDVEDARARYLSALSKEVELQSRLMDSQYALREVLGSLPPKLSKLKPNIEFALPEPKDAQKWVELSAERNLELQSMNLTLDVAEREVKSLKGGHYPTVDLVYSYNNTNTEGSVFGGGSDIDSGEIALQLKVPLYSGGKTSSKIRQAIEKRNSIYHDRNDKKHVIERSTHDAYFRISTAIVQIDALEQSVTALERLLDSKTSGYRVGKNSILETLDVEQDLSAAQQILTKARYDYVLNVLRLKFSAGNLQEEDLAAVNNWLES